MQAASAQNVTF